jgi:hypothetical protein
VKTLTYHMSPEMIADTIQTSIEVFTARRESHSQAINNGDNLFQYQVMGDLCTRSAAEALGASWHGTEVVRDPKDLGPGRPNVGKDIQVRGTSYLTGRLLLQPTDFDDNVFILVVNRCPDFDLMGWMYGHEGKQDKFWREVVHRRPCYWVPSKALHHMLTLTSDHWDEVLV